MNKLARVAVSGGIFLIGLIKVAAGMFIGLLSGLFVSLAVIAVRARTGSFLFSVDEILAPRFEMVLLFAGVLIGGYFGWRAPARGIRLFVRAVAGAVVGALLGALVGSIAFKSPELFWTVAMVFAAISFVAALILALPRVRGNRLTLTDSILVSVIAIAALVGYANVAATDIAAGAIDVDPEPLPPLSSVSDVVFLIGDAGAAEAGRSPLLDALAEDVDEWSLALDRDSAVSVVFAGDLVYPVGIRDRDHEMFERDSSRLWNQIALLGGPNSRRRSSFGMFVAGNHDWGNLPGREGVERIKNLDEQMKQGRALGFGVELVPSPGDPGPVYRDIRDVARFIYVDTHWFLQERTEAIRTRFLSDLKRVIEDAGDRHVVIVSHHPYNSAGPHGAVVPGLSRLGIEFLMSKTGALVQDLNSPIYAELLAGFRRVFSEVSRPPLLFVGGHDHSLQVIESQIESDPSYSLVSGAGSKISTIATVPGMLYGASRPGYMMLVIGKDNSVQLFVVAGDADLMKCDSQTESLQGCMTLGANRFDVVYGRTLTSRVGSHTVASGATVEPPKAPDEDEVRDALLSADVDPLSTAWWTSDVLPHDNPIAEDDEDSVVPPVAVPARRLYFRPDSVVTTTGTSYSAGAIHSIALGNLNRHLWDLPVKLPVLNLDELGGGITVDEITGGMQTFGLKLDGENGKTYQFRSIVKDASRALESDVAMSIVGGTLDDQLSSQFPLAAVVVAELIDAVGVLVAKPRVVIMPNDDRLGAYRPFVAGRVGWIEVRPNERGDSDPGFAGSKKVIGGVGIYEKLVEDTLSFPDVDKYLRTRMVDFLVGDWDRHSDNWRWAVFDDSGRRRWEPIPRDRDWAFPRSDGIVTAVQAVVFPRFVGFSSELPPIDRISSAAYWVDHRILSGVPRERFLSAADTVRQLLNDDVLRRALGALPREYYAVEGDKLFESLVARREGLKQYADEYYSLQAKTAHVLGFEDVPVNIAITMEGSAQIRVQARLQGSGQVYYDRIFDTRTTTTVRLFVTEGRDVVDQPDELPVDVFVHSLDEYRAVDRDY